MVGPQPLLGSMVDGMQGKGFVMRHLGSVPILVAIGVLAPPCSAFARPTLAADHACYAESSKIEFTGNGYTPGGTVMLLLSSLPSFNGTVRSYPLTADDGGAIRASFSAPKLSDFGATPPRYTLSVTAKDQAKLGPTGPIGPPEDTFASTQATVSIWDIAEPWDDSAGPARGHPKRRVTLTVHGWASLGSTLYGHYLRAGRLQRTVKIGALKAPCGDLTATMREFPFRPVPAGRYRIVFDASKTYNRQDPADWYETVVVARKDAVR